MTRPRPAPRRRPGPGRKVPRKGRPVLIVARDDPASLPVVTSARRLEIRRRAPDRARLRIAGSRVPAADPWLDDEYDWEL